MNIPCPVEAAIRIMEREQDQAERNAPTDAEVEDKRQELIDDFLSDRDNANEAFGEEVTSHPNLWAPIAQALYEKDDAEVGRLIRQSLSKYAERCTSRQLESWIERETA